MTRHRRRKLHSRSIGDDHIAELATGWDFFHGAWNHRFLKGDEQDVALVEMKAAYLANREAVHESFYQGPEWSWRKPWAWWQFEASPPRDETLPEWLDLWRRGEITTDVAKLGARFELGHRPTHLNQWILLLEDSERRLLGVA